MEPGEPRRSSTVVRAVLTVFVALSASLFLLFILGPVAGLVGAGGARGIRALGGDSELRASLMLTATTATIASLLGVIGGTPLAYLLARKSFRGRALVAAL